MYRCLASWVPSCMPAVTRGVVGVELQQELHSGNPIVAPMRRLMYTVPDSLRLLGSTISICHVALCTVLGIHQGTGNLC